LHAIKLLFLFSLLLLLGGTSWLLFSSKKVSLPHGSYVGELNLKDGDLISLYYEFSLDNRQVNILPFSPDYSKTQYTLPDSSSPLLIKLLNTKSNKEILLKVSLKGKSDGIFKGGSKDGNLTLYPVKAENSNFTSDISDTEEETFSSETSFLISKELELARTILEREALYFESKLGLPINNQESPKKEREDLHALKRKEEDRELKRSVLLGAIALEERAIADASR
jgi:hypothetical protein